MMRFLVMMLTLAAVTATLLGAAEACRDASGRYTSCNPPVIGR